MSGPRRRQKPARSRRTLKRHASAPSKATERQRIAIYSDLPAQVLLGLAARDFAGKMKGIEHLNVTPDLLAAALGAFQAAPAAAAVVKTE